MQQWYWSLNKLTWLIFFSLLQSLMALRHMGWAMTSKMTAFQGQFLSTTDCSSESGSNRDANMLRLNLSYVSFNINHLDIQIAWMAGAQGRWVIDPQIAISGQKSTHASSPFPEIFNVEQNIYISHVPLLRNNRY